MQSWVIDGPVLRAENGLQSYHTVAKISTDLSGIQSVFLRFCNTVQKGLEKWPDFIFHYTTFYPPKSQFTF